MVEPGSRPANGLATCAVRKLLVASSRTGEVEKYRPGTELICLVTGTFSERPPRYVPSIRIIHGSSRCPPIDQRCVRGVRTSPTYGKDESMPTFVINPRLL